MGPMSSGLRHRRHPHAIPGAFRGCRAHRSAVGVAAARRPEPALRQRRHGAVQALLPGPGDAAVRPRDQRPEVHPDTGHRGRRQDHAARHVLRDVRQLLLRRLLQGRRHRAGLGPRHEVRRRWRLRARGEPAVAVDPARRRRGARAVDEDDRSPGRPDRQARSEGELLVDGRARAGWPVLGDPLRPRCVVRPGRRVRDHRAARHADRPRGPLPRDLEPGLHAGRALRCPQQGGLRHRGIPAEEEHRHRHGPRACRLPAPGQGEHVRDRRHVPRHREGRGAHRQAGTAPTTSTTYGSGSSPTTSARR